MEAQGLVQDLLIVLAAGWLAGVVCRKLNGSLLIGYLAVGVLIGGFFVWRGAAGPAELPAPKIKVKQEIPDHLKGKLSPEVEAQIRHQTQKYGELDPNAPAQQSMSPGSR